MRVNPSLIFFFTVCGKTARQASILYWWWIRVKLCEGCLSDGEQCDEDNLRHPTSLAYAGEPSQASRVSWVCVLSLAVHAVGYAL